MRKIFEKILVLLVILNIAIIALLVMLLILGVSSCVGISASYGIDLLLKNIVTDAYLRSIIQIGGAILIAEILVVLLGWIVYKKTK